MTYSVLNEGVGHPLPSRSPLDVDINNAKRPKVESHRCLKTEVAVILRQAADNVSELENAGEERRNLLCYEDAILAWIESLGFLESHRQARVDRAVVTSSRRTMSELGVHCVFIYRELLLKRLNVLGLKRQIAVQGVLENGSNVERRNLLVMDGSSMLAGCESSVNLMTRARGHLDISNILGRLVDVGVSVGLLNGHNGIHSDSKSLVAAAKDAGRAMVFDGNRGGRDMPIALGNNLGLAMSDMIAGEITARLIAKGGSAGLLNEDNRGLGMFGPLVASARTRLALKTSSAGLLDGSNSGMGISNVLAAKGSATLGAERSATLDDESAWSGVWVVRAEGQLVSNGSSCVQGNRETCWTGVSEAVLLSAKVPEELMVLLGDSEVSVSRVTSDSWPVRRSTLPGPGVSFLTMS
ncbi:hypothetical protein QBC34DRAFT_17580 [Podospora aff. communis PSN243]|uniref:Uncharacterized protein n=1 Tax=Podospora aff. communis PSN243 TaxID=3040156 RepID=A0AAV9GYH9_9PEZI|nr:hypothetical protein QBC34DRAFT_17580 [Podospora aff. communis PSN243]